MPLPDFSLWFQHYGLAAVFCLLLLENFGLPLPGEAVLLVAAYQVARHGVLSWPALVAVAVAACVLGQAAGYLIGRHYGAWARRVFNPRRREAVEAYFRRYGAWTIFFARFITGVRIAAGPVAGLYAMPRRPFMTFNLLGALVWVSTLTAAGDLAGRNLVQLQHLVAESELALLALVVILVLALWYFRRPQRRHD